MKVRNLFFAVLASAAVLVGCEEKEELGGPAISVNPESVTFEQGGATKSVNVTASRDWTIVETTIPEGYVIDPMQGTASSKATEVKITAPENNSFNIKDHKITFSAGLVEATLTVNQDGGKGELERGDGSKEKPYLASEANALGVKLGAGNTTSEAFYVIGYVKKLADKHEEGVTDYGNGSFYITDTESGEGDDFYCFQVYYLNGKKFTSADQIKVGDQVVVYGKITNYNGTIETVGKGQAHIAMLNGSWEEDGSGDSEIPENPTLTPIKNILSLYNGTDVNLEKGTYIKGVVVSNAALNNLTSKMNMFIQDTDGGIQIRFSYDSPVIIKDENDKSTHPYAFGDELILDLSGAELSAYEGAVQINNHAGAVKKTASSVTVEPRPVTMTDFLENKYYSQYVQITDVVQVVDADLEKNWANSTSEHTNIAIETADGQKTTVFTSKYATLAKVAQGSGQIKGISTGSNDESGKFAPNLTFAQATDADALTGARFASAPYLTATAVTPNVAAEATEAKITINTNVAWTATVTGGATLSKASGTKDDAEITVSFNANTDEGASKEYTVTFKADGCDDVVVTITQAKKPGEGAKTETLSFLNWGFDGASDWGQSYAAHTVEFPIATVEFEKANKQAATAEISDCPVTKGNYVIVKMKNSAVLSAVKVNLKQWSTKSQVVTLHTSSDNGNSFTATELSSNTFTLDANGLPVGTNAIKITFSSTSNQVGVVSFELQYE